MRRSEWNVHWKRVPCAYLNFPSNRIFPFMSLTVKEAKFLLLLKGHRTFAHLSKEFIGILISQSISRFKHSREEIFHFYVCLVHFLDEFLKKFLQFRIVSNIDKWRWHNFQFHCLHSAFFYSFIPILEGSGTKIVFYIHFPQ